MRIRPVVAGIAPPNAPVPKNKTPFIACIFHTVLGSFTFMAKGACPLWKDVFSVKQKEPGLWLLLRASGFSSTVFVIYCRVTNYSTP